MLAERAELMSRLTRLCGLPAEQLAARVGRIQAGVERLAAAANRRRQSEAAETAALDESWAARLRRLLLEDPPPPRITVAEELAYHVVAEDVPAAVATEINAHADRYRGAKLVELSRRPIPVARWPPTCSGILVRRAKKIGPDLMSAKTTSWGESVSSGSTRPRCAAAGA